MGGEESLVNTGLVSGDSLDRRWAFWCPLTKVFSGDNELKKKIEVTIFTRPSQDEEANMVLSTFDQSTLNASRECSRHARRGNSFKRSDREYVITNHNQLSRQETRKNDGLQNDYIHST